MYNFDKGDEQIRLIKEFNDIQRPIEDALMEQYKLGKEPRYVVVNKAFHDKLKDKYEAIHGVSGFNTVTKFAVYYGYIDIIVLDREDQVILVG